MTHFKVSKGIGLGILIWLASLAAGLYLTSFGIITWDDAEHYFQSQWLLAQYGIRLVPTPDISFVLKWYGPLWEIILGLFTEVIFKPLNDPFAVRHAVTFSLFPLTLYLTFKLLRRAGVTRSTSVLILSLIFGIIRLGGHAYANVKDFPFACVFLLITLYLWNLLCEQQESFRKADFSKKQLAKLAFVSVLPYLFRPPVLLHFGILGATIAHFSFHLTKKRNWKVWMKPAFLFGVFGVAFIWVFMPAIRTEGWDRWLGSFRLFSRFTWEGPVHIFGNTYLSTRLPRWYPLAWLPVILDPFAFLSLGVGIGIFTFKKFKNLSPSNWARFHLSYLGRDFSFTLLHWVALITGLTWGAVFITKPTLYDEERHLLFLFPILMLLVGLAFENVLPKIKYALAAIIVISSAYSYGEWGRYSYIYKSILIGDRSGSRFMGDYWGACLAPSLQVLFKKVPPPARISVYGPTLTTEKEADFLLRKEGKSLAESGYTFFARPPQTGPYIALKIDRTDDNDQFTDQAVQMGRGHEIWTERMPPGSPSCHMISIQ